MHSITELLNLEDSDIQITDIQIEGTQKVITLETPVMVHYCPSCNYRMHSRGIRTRRLNHPILQDNYELILILRQRRWRCTNPNCQYETNEQFQFVNPYRRSTNATDWLIVLAFKDLSLSATAIAARFNTSDTHVMDVFDRYVRMNRLPLTDIISVDEVYLNLDESCKYSLVIQDFHTGEPIDLLITRRQTITEPYFSSIPKEERFRVRYLISDMYNPYISYVRKYFPNAVAVVDSFHVIQWCIHAIDVHIRQLLKNYRKRDRDREDQLSADRGYPVKLPMSKEVYLLQNYRWLILSNRGNITYHGEPRMDRHLHRMMNTYDYEDELFRIDSNLRDLRNLKEMYITFNARNAGRPMDARIELDELIHRYMTCDQPIFRKFGDLLIKYHDEIINSFIMAEKHGYGQIYNSRLSNGPIESLNRKAKDLKRLGRGYRNFEHFRTRFLYATRSNPTISSPAAYSAESWYENDGDIDMSFSEVPSGLIPDPGYNG